MAKKGEAWDEEKILSVLDKSSVRGMKLARAFDGLEEPFTALALLNPRENTEIRAGIFKKYAEKNREIVYITASAGYEKLKEDFTKRKISLTNTVFIDMVSMDRGLEAADTKEAKYIESPTGLTDCLIKTEKLLKGKTMVLLDSLSTTLVYNEPSAIGKFVHSLVGKINSAKASAILFSSNSKESKNIANTISHFVDKTIEL